MRIVRLAPHTFRLDRTEHVGNRVQVSTDSNFVHKLINMEITTLNYYKLMLEPSPSQPLWVRFKRKIKDIDSGAVTEHDFTTPIKIEYISSQYAGVPSDYVEKPVLYINGNVFSIVDGSRLEHYLKPDKTLVISVGKFRSDNPTLLHTHVLVETINGDVIFQAAESEASSFVVPFENVTLNDSIIIHIAQTNINGITSKFTSHKLSVKETLLFESHNLFPRTNVFGTILLKVTNTLDTCKIIIRDSRHKVVHVSDTNRIVLERNTLQQGEDYSIRVSGRRGNTNITYSPLTVTALNRDRAEVFTKCGCDLMVSATPIHVVRTSSLYKRTLVQVDEIDGLFLDLENGQIALKNIDPGSTVDAIKFNTLLETNFIVRSTTPHPRTITKFHVFALGENRFLLDVEGTFGRNVAIYRYDLGLKIIKVEHLVHSKQKVTNLHGSITVLDVNTFVMIFYTNGKTYMRIIRRTEDNHDYTYKTTKLFNSMVDVKLLHTDKDTVVLYIQEAKYRYSIYDFSKHIVGGKVVPNHTAGFELQSGDYIYIDKTEGTVKVDNRKTIKPYVVPYVSNRVIRFENNTFMLEGTDGDPAILCGDSVTPFDHN